jgi:hypothetical protein
MAHPANSSSAPVINIHFKMKAVTHNAMAARPVFAGLLLLFFAMAAAAQSFSFDWPLYFEANKNQTQFLSRGSSYQFLISAGGAQIVLRNAAGGTATAQMQLVGANARAQIQGDGELPGKINYLIGSDPGQWQTGLPTFSRVQISEIYPGINLVFHGNQRQLEYDFAIAPGANPDTIKIRFQGADKISLGPDGGLVLNIGGGEICQPKPEIYQTVGGTREVVSGGYKILDAQTVAFETGAYNHSLPLVIDPLLSYSAYFGGIKGDTAYAIALDTNSFADSTNGYIYIAGQTVSKQFFTPGASQTNYAGGNFNGDAFVAKFSNPPNDLIYLTYLGGKDDDAAFGLAVDAAGNAFVAGFTASSNFPTANAICSNIPTAFNVHVQHYFNSAFVSELDPSGSSLVYSTYLGGTNANIATSIALDSADNAYVAGCTYSTNFPISTNALQSSLACSNNFYFNANAFVSELSSNENGSTSNLLYSTYVGGTNFDAAESVAVGSDGYVYVAGLTSSTNFPTWNTPTNQFTNFPAIDHLNGNVATNLPNVRPSSRFDAFAIKFQPFSTQLLTNKNQDLVYSTYLGGTNSDAAYGIAPDSAGNAYVTGWTASTNFPIWLPNPNNPGYTGYSNYPAGLFSYLITNPISGPFTTNIFLTKIASAGSNILASVVFGGRGQDIGYKVAVDSQGQAFVIGSESSTNFPTTNTFDSLAATNASGLQVGGQDVFVASFNTNWSAMNYSVCIGGKKDDAGYGIALDSSDDAFITGKTMSTNFPTQFPNQYSFIFTNITYKTNIVHMTNVISTNMVFSTNLIGGAKLTGTNDAFLAEIQFTPPAPTDVQVQPPGATNTVGANLTFEITGNGTGFPVLFQWQRETITNGIPSGVFTNLLNKGRFNGVTADVLTITNIQTNDTGTYSAIVYYGGPPITNTFLIQVTPQPLIIVPPVDQTNAPGSNVTFTVTALGQPPLHYQWQLNGTNLVDETHVTGVTTNTLTLTDITTNEAGTYEVIITNSFGSTNASATLNVVTAPFILTPLTNQVVGLGSTVNFAVTVIGKSPIHYSWQMNGTILANGGQIKGATTNILILTNAAVNNSGTYQVVVTNIFGSASNSATLTVLTAPRMSIGLVGGLLSFNVVGGTNDGVYDLLFTNDLLAPLSTWPRVGPATFGDQGQYSFELDMNDSTQQFYILQQTTNN